MPPLIAATFLERPNRFVAVCESLYEAGPFRVHVANPGRCAELLVPGCTVWLAPAPPGAKRKTAYTMALVRHEGALVSMRSHLANDLFAEALAAGRIAGLEGLAVRREVTHGASRFDFRLGGEDDPMWVEVKSVTLVEGDATGQRVALFPDAPTARGARHVRELAEIARAGGQAMIAFVVQREDAVRVEPHCENDPAFAAALGEAVEAGVAVRAWRCSATMAELVIGDELPVVVV